MLPSWETVANEFAERLRLEFTLIVDLSTISVAILKFKILRLPPNLPFQIFFSYCHDCAWSKKDLSSYSVSWMQVKPGDRFIYLWNHWDGPVKILPNFFVIASDYKKIARILNLSRMHCSFHSGVRISTQSLKYDLSAINSRFQHIRPPELAHEWPIFRGRIG